MSTPLPSRLRTLALGFLATGIAVTALAPSAQAGTFVIGDQEAAVGNHVTFWGAQWWKENPLSTSSAPPAFKGYADTASGTCGENWTTAPGNSSDPPGTLPPVIPVVVSDQVTKSGPVISGDTTEVVAVQVDPGYAANPGHPGTGTVISILCAGGPIST
jgi:hypothetical protein